MSFKRRGYIKAAISTLICTPILFMNYDVVNAKSIERDYVRECEIIERTQPNENIDIDTFNVSRNIIEKNIISYACNFLGTPYVYGANGPNSFDCSGFTKYIFESISINLPRTSQAQYYNGILVNKEDLKNGDLVSSGMPTVLVTETSNPSMTCNIKETDLDKVDLGQEVTIKLPAYDNQEFKGKVTNINKNADFATKKATNDNGDFDILSYGVKVEFDDLEELSDKGITLRANMTTFVDFGK